MLKNHHGRSVLNMDVGRKCESSPFRKLQPSLAVGWGANGRRDRRLEVRLKSCVLYMVENSGIGWGRGRS